MSLRFSRAPWADLLHVKAARALAGRGLPSIVLKGPSFAAWLYGGEQREYVDADILVPAAERKRTILALEDAGFAAIGGALRATERPRHAVSFRALGTSNEAELDVHFGLLGAGAEPDAQWRLLWARRQVLHVAATPLWQLDRIGRSLHVCLHAATNGVGDAKTGEDLRRALTSQTPDHWIEARRLAVVLDAETAMLAGLSLLPEGRAVVSTDVNGTQALPMAVRLRLRYGSDPLVRVVELLRLPRRDLVRGLSQELVPSTTFMREHYESAARGRLGLVQAHLRRWLHLLRLVPGGLLRAAKAAQGKEFDR